MLTHASRPLTAVRAFIVAPPKCVANTLPTPPPSVSVTPCSSLHTCRQKTRHVPGATPLRTFSSHPDKLVPYALTAAAQAFEEQVRRREFDFLAESYGHLRQVVLEAQRRGLTPTHGPLVSESVLKDAMALLVASPEKEHAALHLTIFKDVAPVFRVHSEMVHPLVVAAEIFPTQLENGAVDASLHIYEHFRHLCNISPDKSQVFPTELAVGRVTRWMKLLSKHPQREIVELLQTILHDLPRLFQLTPTLTHHDFIIKAFLSMDMPDDAWTWLRKMELSSTSPRLDDTKPPSFWDRLQRLSGLGADPKPPIPMDSNPVQSWVKPSAPQYDLLLNYFSQRGDVVSARMLITHMSVASTGAPPSQRSWHLLLVAVLNAQSPASNQRARVLAIVEELEQAGHAVHLKLLGGIMRKGHVAGLVDGEVFDVLRAAQTRSNQWARNEQDVLGTDKRQSQVRVVEDVLHPGGDEENAAASTITRHQTTPKATLSSPSEGRHRIQENSTTSRIIPGKGTNPQAPQSEQTSSTAANTLAEATVKSRDTPIAAAASWGATARAPHTQQTSISPIAKKQATLRQRNVQSPKQTDNTSHTVTATETQRIGAGGSKSTPAIALEETSHAASKAVEPSHLETQPKPSSTHQIPLGNSEPAHLATNERLEGESSHSPAALKDNDQASGHEPGDTPVTHPNSLEKGPAHLEDNDRKSDIPPDASKIVTLSMRLKQRGTLQEPSTVSEAARIGDLLRPLDLGRVVDGGIALSTSPARLLQGDLASPVGIGSTPAGDSLQESSPPYLQLDGQQETLVSPQGISRKHHPQTDNPEADTLDLPSNAAPPVAPRHPRGDSDNATFRKLTRLVHSAINRGDLRDASKYYADLIKVARPNLDIGLVLLRALCSGSLRAPPRPHVMQALRIYKDLIEAEKQDAAETTGFFDGTQPRERRIDPRIYHILLRALSAPASTLTSSRDFGPEVEQEYTKLAMDLLAEMDTRGFRPDNKVVTSVLLLRFRSAKNHREAFKSYRTMLTELEHAASSSAPASSLDLHAPHRSASPVLDLTGFRAVLNAFGKLSFSDAPVAPAYLWFSIVDDMRTRGYLPTVEDYTIYLGAIMEQKAAPLALQRASLGTSSSAGEESHMKALYGTVKHVHEKLSLDPHISPDPHLLNTLMNAYQHLGAFDDALRVFNIIWLSGRMDDVTPNILFDACGHAGRQDVANMVWCMLVAKGWEFNKRTLDTWVECLCRLGSVEAACKFVCVYMGREKAGYLEKEDTRPDVQTCLILLKLSWIIGQNIEVKEKIQVHLPHIWNKLAPHYK